MNFKLFFLCLMISLYNSKAQTIPMYIGTYTDGNSEGIYRMQFNLKTGELSSLQFAAASENPSFIAYSRNKRHLYAVNESSGTVSSFKIQENGLLKFLNKVSSNGDWPCHISINKLGNKAVVSNYGGGSVSIYNISRDGKLNEASQIFQYNTSDRKSHAHSAQFFNDALFVSDLGMNAVYRYQLKNNDYELYSSNIIPMSGNPGPRHFALTKNGQFIYIINEYGSSVTSVKKTENGFEQIDYDATLDENYKGENSCADIHLSKNEHFLYASNRGENTIAVFKRNLHDGTIEKTQTISVQGDWPRNFTIDPTGNFILVANQKSDTISVFKINPKTGMLSFLNSVMAPTPVCLLF
ncbi:MAG: lactonase family protein [Flavobacteriaceae bacterium]|nr:lactonase family protein [Flavobacteriaceae bacterium]